MSEALTLYDSVEFLNRLESSRYWESRILNDADNVIIRICNNYQKAPIWERQKFRNRLEVNGWRVLWSFLRRTAMIGARKKSEKWVISGIVALTICAEDPATEYYDVLMDLAILYHSACLVGDPRRIFEEGVRHVEDERIRHLILGFLERDAQDQRLEAMGWEAIEGPSGLIYRFDDQPIPEGHL